ncbi:MAG: hypothetical protein ABIR30_13885 [Chitinophagaceae bacterium]
MRQPLFAGYKPALAMLSTFLIISISQAQYKKIDWANDTISKADAVGMKNTYVNTVRGSGQLATEKIILPVDKMKEIFDACAAHNITDVSVMIVSIRQNDIVRLRKTNPEITSTGGQMKGRQLLVFKVPREAFAGQTSSKINLTSSNPLMLSLLGAGLSLVDMSLFKAAAAAGDIYFSIGTICPPPASCD